MESIMLHPMNASLNHFVEFVQKIGSGMTAVK